MPPQNQEPNLEEKLRELAEQANQVSDETIRQDLQRQIDELQAQIESGSKRFVDSKDLEETLREINSHILLPKDEYFVNFDITINPQGILEIEPGTEIYFSPEAGIISYGTLRAIGTEGENILFTSFSDLTWKNIAITGESASKSILEYCKITNGSGRRAVAGISFSNMIYYPGDKLEHMKVGGALLIVSSSPTIRYCTITNNQTQDGGGIFIFKSKPTLEENTITNNQAPFSGGGLFLLNSNPTLKRNTITNNTAMSGGGLYLEYSNPSLQENTIINNAAMFGGGLYLKYSDPIMEKNTIKHNKPDNITKDEI